MCISYTELANCGCQVGRHMQRCAEYEANPGIHDAQPVPRRTQLLTVKCDDCENTDGSRNLDIETLRQEAQLVREEYERAILTAGKAYSGQQRENQLKRYEDNTKKFEALIASTKEKANLWARRFYGLMNSSEATLEEGSVLVPRGCIWGPYCAFKTGCNCAHCRLWLGELGMGHLAPRTLCQESWS